MNNLSRRPMFGALLSLLVLGLGTAGTTAPQSLTWQAGTPPTYADSGAVSVRADTGGPLFTYTQGAAKAIFITEGRFDLGAASTLSVNLVGPFRGQVAVALSTGDGWTWQESSAQEGGRPLEFDLRGEHWKSAATDWTYTASLKNAAQTHRIALLLFPAAGAGGDTASVTLRQLSWTAGALAQKAPGATPAPPLAVAKTPGPTAGQRPFTKLTLVGVPAEAPSLTPITMSIQTDGVVSNPYDPGQADMQLTVTGPGGRPLNVPAFYGFQVDETGRQLGAPGWMARFTPTAPGRYTVTAAVNGVSSAAVALNVTPGSGPGFIGVSPVNSRLFAYQNGDLYVPIGLNIAWTGKDALGEYRKYFDALSRNGGTFARVWMPAWGLGLEWKDTGLGDYAARETQMAQLDEVFKMARQRGIQIELCLINHGQFSETVNAEWKDNPYNAANGGPLKTPGEFVTNPQAKALFKRRLRYLAARFAAYPNLFAWEYWNEINWTPISDTDLKPWVQEMTTALRGYDPYHHLISTSYSGGAASLSWKLPELGFAQQHLYTTRELPLELTALIRQFRETVPNKPVLLAELGYSAGGSDAPLDTERTQLHTGLWAPLFLGYAGSGMYWWWDTLIGPKNLWGEYRGLGTFLTGQLQQGGALAPMRPVSVQTAAPNVEAHALRSSDHALVYLTSDQYSAAAANRAYTEALISGKAGRPGSSAWTQELPPRQTTLSVRGLRDGTYTAQWFDPQAGRWLGSVQVRSRGGVLRLQTPQFARDLALSIAP